MNASKILIAIAQGIGLYFLAGIAVLLIMNLMKTLYALITIVGIKYVVTIVTVVTAYFIISRNKKERTA